MQVTSMPTTDTASAGGKSRTVSPKLIISVVIGAVALWFIIANTETARIRLFFVTVSAPVWLVLLITFAAGGAAWHLYLRRSGKKP